LRPDLYFAYPGDLATPTGGYGYGRRVLREWRDAGRIVETIGFGDGFPFPSPAVLCDAYAKLGGLAPGIPVLVDGLALGVLPEIGRHLPAGSRLVALVHHPLAFETGLSPSEVERLRRGEIAALAAADHIVVTSQTTAGILHRDFGIPVAKLAVAAPGTDPAAFSTGSGSGTPLVLSVGTVVPRKGHDIFVEALALCSALSWKALIVGDDCRDTRCTAELRRHIERLNLTSRIELTGAQSAAELESLYRRADVFALASRYEGFGMAYAEAIAHGLPVIGTTGGAIPEAVPKGTGILVPPDDAAAFSGALREVLSSPARRRDLAEGARTAAQRQVRWPETAAAIAARLLSS
jgi:glycosyltransferase involved in cell wall biosynthesis